MRKLIVATLSAFLVAAPAFAGLLGETVKGTTDYSVELTIIDSTDGTRETGVVFNTAGIDLWYRREGAALSAITEATLAALTTAHADGGFLHISDGVYRLDLPDAAVATGADYVSIGGEVTGMIVIGGRVKLTDVDMNDGVRGGMTALPNAAADAAGGLPISDAGALDLDALNVNINDIETDTAVIGAAGAGLTALATQASVNTIDTNVDAILVDTGTTLDGALATVDANVDAILVDTGTTLDGALATVDANVDAILLDTAEIGAAGAGLTALATQASVNTIDGIVDAIVVDTGTDIPARFDGVEGATFATGTDSLEAIRNRGDAAWTTGGAGTGTPTLADDTAQGGSASTIQLAASETFGDDALNGNSVCINSGTGLGQCRNISDYVSSTDTATVEPDWATNPDATSNYYVQFGSVNVSVWDGADITTALETSADIADAVRAEPCGTETADTFGDLICNDLEGVANGTIDVDADVESFLGTALTETTGGRIAGNFDTFFENADAATTNTVDDVGGAGGVADWTTGERNEIRGRLGITGTTAAGGNTPTLALEASLATVDSNVDAILVDTGTTLPASIATIDGNVDAILVDTGTTLDAALAVVDANVDAVLADTGTDGVALGANSITAAVIAADAIGSSELAATAANEIWGVACEDQGGGYTCQEAMSLLLAEALGTCTYTSGTRTWVCADPSGTETRFTLVYGVELDGDRTSSTPAPITP